MQKQNNWISQILRNFPGIKPSVDVKITALSLSIDIGDFFVSRGIRVKDGFVDCFIQDDDPVWPIFYYLLPVKVRVSNVFSNALMWSHINVILYTYVLTRFK